MSCLTLSRRRRGGYLAPPKSDGKRRAALYIVIRGNGAAMGIDNTAHDRESDAESLGFCRDERREQLAVELGSETRPAIGDKNAHVIRFHAAACGDTAPGRRSVHHRIHAIHHE